MAADKTSFVSIGLMLVYEGVFYFIYLVIIIFLSALIWSFYIIIIIIFLSSSLFPFVLLLSFFLTLIWMVTFEESFFFSKDSG